MIAERALTLAGDGAVLVARPKSDVAHVYVGPLTPSGASVPRSRRAVCRAHTRRLTVLPERWTSLDPRESGPSRVCARCSARLGSSLVAQAGRACPTSRDQYAAAFGDLTARDIWAQALMAETHEELQAVAHVSLVVLGHRECDRPLPFLTTDNGRAYRQLAAMHIAVAGGARTLTQTLGRLRERLADYPNRARGEHFTALVEGGYAQAKSDRIAAWKEREARINRLGFVTASRTA